VIDSCERIGKLSDIDQKLLFYSELMKFYKYITEIPELLTLGGLVRKKSLKNLIFVMHLINIFAENVGRLTENKNFILLLIYKSLKYSNGNGFLIFRNVDFRIECDNGSHELTFFTWEMNSYWRQTLKEKRITSVKVYEKKILMFILLNYLCQNLFYPKYLAFRNIKVKDELIRSIQILFIRAILTNDCVGCIFDEYLKIVDLINKNIK
jgi:hypothetical protein